MCDNPIVLIDLICQNEEAVVEDEDYNYDDDVELFCLFTQSSESESLMPCRMMLAWATQ
jgi:hypothetical protein